MKKILFISVVLSVVSCKPLPPFHQDRTANTKAQFKAVKQLQNTGDARVMNSSGKAMIVIQSTMPKSAVAVNVETGAVLWSVPTPDANSRYVIAGPIVAYNDAKKGVVALDINSGKVKWTRKLTAKRVFLGMSGDRSGKLAVISVYKQRGSSLNQISELLVLNSSGKEVYKVETQGRMGWPLVSSRFIAVPYRSQYLVVMDKSKPVEIARIHVKNGEIRFVEETRNGVFFGDKSGIYSLKSILANGPQTPRFRIKSEIRHLEFNFARDHYSSIMKDYSAYDMRLLHGDMVSGLKTAEFSKDTIVFNMFRYLFGFDVKDGNASVKWAVSIDGDNLAGLQSYGEILFYITKAGVLGAVNMVNGEKLWSRKLEVENIRGASFDMSGFIVPAGSPVSPAPLLDSLTEIANDPDTRFPLAKRFAIDALAVVGGAGVSRLLSMITNPKSSKMLRDKAEHDLIARPDKKGIPLYINLISTPFDFIKGTRPLAIGVMADVLGKLKSVKAVDPLLRLMVSPHITTAELLKVTEALLAIGDKRIVRPFREFLLAYRADPSFAQDIHPLQKMAEGLFKMGGSAERQVLLFLSEDQRTLPRLKVYIERMLNKTRTEKK
ncbi:MAG: PQQ-binding-like beta-propeller repeat protein [Deltaproteobacteria bacterium]|nr:PQQ-binding-like beta-propeller repeat protein [Deltaproteobacteria bacterium]